MKSPGIAGLVRLATAVSAMLLLQAAAAGADLLEPGRAFRFSARLVSPELIEVRYQIADGYYLYRDKFRFSAVPDSVILGTPELPDGKIAEDEFFGRVETYRRDLTIRIPLQGAANLKFFTLKAVSQGCADVGVCYVPQTQTIRLRLGGLPLSGISGGSVEVITRPSIPTDGLV